MPPIGRLSHQEIEDSGAMELSKMPTPIPLLGASDRSVVYPVYEATETEERPYTDMTMCGRAALTALYGRSLRVLTLMITLHM